MAREVALGEGGQRFFSRDPSRRRKPVVEPHERRLLAAARTAAKQAALGEMAHDVDPPLPLR